MKKHVVVMFFCFTGLEILSLGACNETLELEERAFRCNPSLPCAEGYVCREDPSRNDFSCQKQGAVGLGDAADDIDSSDTIDSDAPTPSVLCDPEKDALCFAPCSGWSTVGLPQSATNPGAAFVDLTGNGVKETILWSGTGYRIVSESGAIMKSEEPLNSTTFARGMPVAGDFSALWVSEYTNGLSLLFAPGSDAILLKWSPKNSDLVAHDLNRKAYDFSRFMVTDVNFDYATDFISPHGCDPLADIFEAPCLDPDQPCTPKHWLSVLNPGTSCNFGAGMLATDLDGKDGIEIVIGLGFPNAQKPELWDGSIKAYSLTKQEDVGTPIETCTDDCFNTDKSPLLSGGVTDLFREGDTIHAVVKYFEALGPPVQDGPYFHWRFNTEGEVIGIPKQVDSPRALIPFRPAQGHPDILVDETRTVGLWDVNGDGFPDRIAADGKDLLVELYDPVKMTFVEHAPARLTVGLSAIVRAIGVRQPNDDERRLSVLVAHDDQFVSCLEMGIDTYNRNGSIPPYEPIANRTFQKDTFEPNDGKPMQWFPMDTHRIPWLPPVMTGFGGVPSYLEDSKDVDFFLVKAVGNSQICLDSPPGEFAAYEFDVANRTTPYLPVWESVNSVPESDNPLRKCVTPSEVPGLAKVMAPTSPESTIEVGLFVIRVYTNETSNSDRPYWIETPGMVANEP